MGWVKEEIIVGIRTEWCKMKYNFWWDIMHSVLISNMSFVETLKARPVKLLWEMLVPGEHEIFRPMIFKLGKSLNLHDS